MFIVFEGADGCGKSTQLSLCHEWLSSQKMPVVVCRDPGTTNLGDRVRSLLLDHGQAAIGNRAEMLLFMVARAQLVEEVIQPALQQQQIVLCDRFLLSTVVYQGHAGELETEDVYRVGEIATQGLTPDLTLVFDLPSELAQQRLGPSKDRMESRGSAFFEKVRQGFLVEAEQRADIHVVDAGASKQQVHSQVRSIIESMPGSALEEQQHA